MRASSLLVAVGVGVATASAVAQPEAPVDHATVRLWSPKPNLEPGRTEMLVLDFTIDDGWHLYWNGLSDTGMPPEVEWKLPPGFEFAGPVLWPAPTRHVAPGGLLDHIYEKRVMLFAEVRAPKDAIGTARIEADLKWLVCSDVCLPGDGHVALDLTIGSIGDGVPFDAETKRFLSRVPSKAPKDAGVKVALAGDSCDIRVPGAKKITFYPLAGCTPPADLLNEGVAEGESLRLTVKPRKGKESRVAGVLEVEFPDRPTKFWTIDTAPAGSPAEQK